MHRRTEETASSSLTLLHDELLTKIWIEHLQSHDRFSFASTCKDFLRLFKSARNSASFHDLQQQTNRVGLEGFPVARLAGIDRAVIDRLTIEFAEDFRSMADEHSLRLWLSSDTITSIKNPYFWQLTKALEPIEESSTQTPADNRKLNFPEKFSPQIAPHIASRYKTSDKVAAFIVSQLQLCSPEHIERINKFLYQEWFSDAFRGYEEWNKYIVAFARYMRISLPLDTLLSHLTTPHHKEQLHAFYMSRFKGGEVSRLQEQLLVDHFFPLLHQQRSTYPTLDDEFYLTAYVYCAHNTPFSIKKDLLRQFFAVMWELKNTYPDVFAYIKREFSHRFTLGLTIGFGSSREYIELLTPYLTRGTAQPVLQKYLSILDKITTYGYHFARGVSYMSRYMNCLSEIKTSHPGLMLSQRDLEDIFELIKKVYQDKDVVKQLVINKAVTTPGLKA